MAQTNSKHNDLPQVGVHNGDPGQLLCPPVNAAELTPRQQEVYDLLLNHIHHHSYPPTYHELAEQLGVSSANSAVTHLKALQRKGLITLVPGISRGIIINGSKEPVLAVQLLRELMNDEPGARARVEEFLRQQGDQQ